MEKNWYSKQILLADAVSYGVLITGLYTKSDRVAWVGRYLLETDPPEEDW